MTQDEELEMLRRLTALEAEPSRLEKFVETVKTGAKGVGQSLAAGFGKGAAAYPLAMSKAPGVMGLGFNLLGAGRVAKETGEFYNELGKDSSLPEVAKPFVEGAGGAFSIPSAAGMGHPLTAAAAGGVGNTAANVTKEFTRDLGEVPSSLMAAIAGILGGGVTGFTLGPKQTVGKVDLRKALQGADFDKAGVNVDVISRTGSKTGTLAEAFPPNSSVMDLARKARGAETSGLNPLIARTESRTDELTEIGNKIPGLMGPGKVEPGEAAKAGASAAENRLRQMQAAKVADYEALIAQAKPVLPQDVTEFRKFMLQQARNSNQKEVRQAYLDIANAVRGTKGVLTNPRELVDSVKLAKDQAIGKNEGTASVALKKVYEKPYGDFVDFLKDRIPEFKQAEKLYPNASAYIDEMKGSPLGQMAGANFDPAKVVPTSRLSVLEGFDQPENLKRFLDDLQAGDPKNPRLLSDLAKALVQKKTRSGPGNPAEKVAATEGSTQAKMFDELLTQTGTNNPQVQDQLKLARLLQDFQGPGGINSNVPKMSGSQALIRPFRTIDMMLTGQREKGVQQEIATLLADPKNLKKLQEIAMFDPEVRKLLTLQGAATPGLLQSTQ